MRSLFSGLGQSYIYMYTIAYVNSIHQIFNRYLVCIRYHLNINLYFFFLSCFIRTSVENLVRQWAPLVWLAPGEKFMPGNVNDFLRYVHAEKSTTGTSTLPSKVPEEILELGEEYYYEVDNSLTVDGEGNGQLTPPVQRNKRMFREKQKLKDYVIDLPIGQRSLNWFLVSNDNIGKKNDSFV